MSPIQAQLHELASAFASSVLDAIRGASLEELLDEGGRSDRPRAFASAKAARQAVADATRKTKGGRLARRSAEDIAKALDKVVALVSKKPDGLRAEEIRETLGMQAKEMPRILGEGLKSRKLKSKGQKRATTYYAR